jgi:bacteriocin-like protein
MSDDKVDPNKNATEVSPKNKTELTEEELAKVTGGDGDVFLTISNVKGESLGKDPKDGIH